GPGADLGSRRHGGDRRQCAVRYAKRQGGRRDVPRSPFGPDGWRRAVTRHRDVSLSSVRSADARADQAELYQDRRDRGPLRHVAGRSRSIAQQSHLQREQAVLQLRLCDPAQPRGHDRQSLRSGAAAIRDAGRYGAANRRIREVPQGRADRDDLSRCRKGQAQRRRQMMSDSQKKIEEASDLPPPPSANDYIAAAPRISVQAFCEGSDTAAAIESAGDDRRLAKAHLTVKLGGLAAALETYHNAPTPNVIVLESGGQSDLLTSLDELASVCDPGTRVIVVGSESDEVPYRELVRRGVNDYVLGPIAPIDIVRSICSLFSASEAVAVGRIIAVIGAKGGVGASTVAHNVAWAIARNLKLDSVVIDLDLAFGTASLDYNQDPVQGIANAVFQPDRPDSAFIDRLLAKCTDHLSLLAAPAALDRVYDFGANAFDAIFDTLRLTTPCIVLDIPHQWTAWTRRALVGADDILIVAAPDLANLRNTKNIFDLLKAARPNDRTPLYCLNQVGIPKRPEINASEFAKAIECEPIVSIPFDPQMFGSAANNGQMIAEISASHRSTEMFLQIAQRLTGRGETKKARTSFLSPLIDKFRSK